MSHKITPRVPQVLVRLIFSVVNHGTDVLVVLSLETSQRTEGAQQLARQNPHEPLDRSLLRIPTQRRWQHLQACSGKPPPVHSIQSARYRRGQFWCRPHGLEQGDAYRANIGKGPPWDERSHTQGPFSSVFRFHNLRVVLNLPRTRIASLGEADIRSSE